jgi:IclR family transcriptional regulator, acetate operon repressor
VSGNPVDTAPPSYPITVVENALHVLQLVKERGTVRIPEVSRELGVARSSAHRLLATLAYRDYLRQDPGTKAYGAGSALVELGLTVVRQIDIRRVARPYMERLSSETGETVSLMLLDRSKVLFVDCVEGPKSVRVGSRTGLTMPAHCTSAGKAMLAVLPPERLRELYPDDRLETTTDQSIATFADLEAELNQVRSAGYATNFAESEPDIAAVGVAIVGTVGEPSAGLSAAAPASRLDRDRVSVIADALMRASDEIGSRGGTV